MSKHFSRLQTKRAGVPLLAARLLATSALVAVPSFALANPSGGEVVAGSATVAPSGGSTVNINQTSQKAIINWQSFSVGLGETTQFNQPNASAITLNRIVGSDPSQILGTLNANGQVWLINPNGILFGKTARVDVAGLLATTIDIANNDFMAGTYRFNRLSNPGAMVVNDGQITIRNAGLAVLVAPGVENSGMIEANLGQIQLSSAAAFTVDMYGDGIFNFTLDKQVTQAITRPDGTKPTAAVSNSGSLIADGGRIALTANAASSVVSHSINMSGYAQATTATVANGVISLDGGNDGTVEVAGTLNASGNQAGQTGGTVHVTGNNVQLASTSSIDVSGTAGGGTALIGGDLHGGGTLHHALTTSIAAGATVNANANQSSDGGKVVVWSDNQTNFQGAISATGGKESGNGGSAEVSSRRVLDFSGVVDLLAAAGRVGSLLLDPENVTVAVLGSAPALPASGPIALNASQDNSTLSVSTLQNALAFADVTVSTGGIGSQMGDITVAANVAWNGAHSLTLDAYRNITINDGVTISNVGSGNLALHADSAGNGVGSVAFIGSGKVNFSGSTGTVTVFYDPVGGYSHPATFASSVVGHLATFMQVNSANDLQSLQQNLAGVYALNRDINLGSIANFVPVGTAASPFSGALNGFGHTVSGLTITDISPLHVGIFGVIGASGLITSLTLANANVAQGVLPVGGDRGALAGLNQGTISGVILSGTNLGLVGDNAGSIANAQISGFNFVVSVATPFTFAEGGIAGGNSGTITNSSVVGNLSTLSPTADALGGLVGENTGMISRSSAAVSVSGCCFVGGLVGTNSGTISLSFGTGSVSTTTGSAGGLIGSNSGSVSQSNATGNVIVTDFGEGGGLVGENLGTIAMTFATGSVTGPALVGGLVGNNIGPTGEIQLSAASGDVSASGLFAGGLVGFNSGPISQSFATGDVFRIGNLVPEEFGGLLGASVNATVTESFATGNVDVPSGHFVGGLIGASAGAGAVIQVFATGNVSAAVNVGGLIGESGVPLTQSYATGTVVGSTFGVGGLVGTNTTSIAQSYSVGTVLGAGSPSGGLVGIAIGGGVANSYWDIATSGQAISGGGAGLSTAQLQGPALPAGFDPAIWVTNSTSFPFFPWQSASGGWVGNWVAGPTSIPSGGGPSPINVSFSGPSQAALTAVTQTANFKMVFQTPATSPGSSSSALPPSYPAPTPASPPTSFAQIGSTATGLNSIVIGGQTISIRLQKEDTSPADASTYEFDCLATVYAMLGSLMQTLKTGEQTTYYADTYANPNAPDPYSATRNPAQGATPSAHAPIIQLSVGTNVSLMIPPTSASVLIGLPNPAVFGPNPLTSLSTSSLPAVIGGTIQGATSGKTLPHYMLAVGIESGTNNIVALDPLTGGQVYLSRQGTVVGPNNSIPMSTVQRFQAVGFVSATVH